MKKYLVDYEELAKFVDTLISQKYPDEPVDRHKALREKSIEELDLAIGSAIFGSLAKPDLDRLNQLLDQESATEEDYDHFFEDLNLDLAKITERAAQKYAKQFLGADEGDKNA